MKNSIIFAVVFALGLLLAAFSASAATMENTVDNSPGQVEMNASRISNLSLETVNPAMLNDYAMENPVVSTATNSPVTATNSLAAVEAWARTCDAGNEGNWVSMNIGSNVSDNMIGHESTNNLISGARMVIQMNIGDSINSHVLLNFALNSATISAAPASSTINGGATA